MWITLAWMFMTSVAAADPAPVLVAVCAESLRPTLQPWIDARRDGGYDVRVVAPERTVAATRSSIAGHLPDAVPDGSATLLIGDVATGLVPTPIARRFGSTPTAATDDPYGELGVAVGRWPVYDAASLALVVEKTLANDRTGDFGPWRSRVELVGGVGGFGPIADAAILAAAGGIVTTALPGTVRTGILYGSPGHRFYPRDRPMTDAVTDRYDRGCRFWVYAGHGRVTTLDNVPADGPPVLDADTVGGLSRPPGSAPIALMLACYTGAFDATERCFATELLLAPGGPPAVIAATRVTMPYGNAVLATSLIDAVYGERHETIGGALSAAETRMRVATPAGRGGVRMMIDALAAVASPAGIEPADERREHAAMYHLIGDPTMRLHPPRSLEIRTVGDDVVITSPIDGTLTLTFDRPPGTVPPANPDPNDLTTAASIRPITADRPLTIPLPPPTELAGATAARAHVAGGQSYAVGFAPVLRSQRTADDPPREPREGCDEGTESPGHEPPRNR